MIKRKWARTSILLIIVGLISSLIIPSIVYQSSESLFLFGITVFLCLTMVIAGGIIKLVFCRCPNCGYLRASNYISWSSHGKVHFCPSCGNKLTYDDEGWKE